MHIETTEIAGQGSFSQAWACEIPRHRQVFKCQNLCLPPSSDVERGDVVLWTGHATGDLSDLLGASRNILPPGEIRFAERLHHPEDCRAYLAAHVALRRLLADLLGRNPSELAFERNSSGKPRLAKSFGNAAHFNISHTRGRALIGLSRAPIGVDIERMRTLADVTQTANTVFHPDVAAEIARTPSPDRPALFFRHWTLGEALLKATGHGLANRMVGFTFSHRGAPKLTHVASGLSLGNAWSFGYFGPPEF